MSLDVSLIEKEKVFRKGGTGVFIRDAGKTRELTDAEMAERFPDAIVNVLESYETNQVYTANITHNLNTMAEEAGIYIAMWRPEENGWTKAKDITDTLERGLRNLLENPSIFKKFNPKNGWGDYDGLVEFTSNYLRACIAYPEAEIDVSR